MANTYNEKVSAFLLEYVMPRKAGYEEDGTMTEKAMKVAIKLLLDENVFKSENDIKKQAVVDYGVVLPCTIFD